MKKLTDYPCIGIWMIILLHSCSNTTEFSTKIENSLETEKIIMEGKVGDPIKDAAGNSYPTVIIGQQTWMATNLRNTISNCEDAIQMIFTNGVERGPGVKFYDGQARYGYYLNKTDQVERYGALYSYQAIVSCQLCPPGFRIPTREDWEILIETLGGQSVAGPKLLTKGNSGFNGELAGRIDGYGSLQRGSISHWWSSSLDTIRTNQDTTKKRAYILELVSNGNVDMKPYNVKHGNSVRCIKE